MATSSHMDGFWELNSDPQPFESWSLPKIGSSMITPGMEYLPIVEKGHPVSAQRAVVFSILGQRGHPPPASTTGMAFGSQCSLHPAPLQVLRNLLTSWRHMRNVDGTER